MIVGLGKLSQPTYLLGRTLFTWVSLARLSPKDLAFSAHSRDATIHSYVSSLNCIHLMYPALYYHLILGIVVLASFLLMSRLSVFLFFRDSVPLIPPLVPECKPCNPCHHFYLDHGVLITLSCPRCVIPFTWKGALSGHSHLKLP